MSVLVVAAWEPELERFRTLVDSASSDLTVEPVGIGLVDAAVGMTRCIMQVRPAYVIFIGTGGASPRATLSIHDVVVATAARLVDPTAVEGRAALPFAADVISLEGELVDRLFNAGARLGRVWTPLGVTTDDALAQKLGALGDVEHLESYGVARACQAAGVPCAIVLGIANVVGSRGRAEWRDNHVAASARAAEVAHAALSSGP